jgi:acetyltransferase-like isoleucine patch superfamily enzyme
MGDGRLSLGKKVATANTLFNLSSGDISIGNYTIFGQNVIVNTGIHRFRKGKRAGLEAVISGPTWGGGIDEVPSNGYDVLIGEGCWICSGAIIIGPVRIGDHSIIGAGAVVTEDVPSGWFVAGVPAKRICETATMFAHERLVDDDSEYSEN